MVNLIKNKKQTKNGFTLIEALVALGIFIIASMVIAAFITNSYKLQNFTFEQTSAIDEARRGVETMVKELREALPGDTGAYPIELADTHEIIFYADFDRDDAIEKVHYWLEESDFKKGVTEASGNPLAYNQADEQTETISRYVRNYTDAIFTYRDSNYNALSTPADPNEVKLIHVYLKINMFENRAPANYELESDVTLRNLKENL
ncbi:MAG: prepilin-type N-terminal cleavage/methylation domain-containing protein [Patescibacteria group bacterium]